MAQLFKHLTLAQAMILQLVSLRPTWGSLLSLQIPAGEFEPLIRLAAVSAEPVSDPLFPSLSALPLLELSVSLSVSLKNK